MQCAAPLSGIYVPAEQGKQAEESGVSLKVPGPHCAQLPLPVSEKVPTGQTEQLDEPAGEHLADLLKQLAILHGFTADVKWDVGTVHDPFHESHPFRQEGLRAVINELFFAIQRDVRFGSPKPITFRVFGWNKEQRVQIDRCI